MEPVEIGPADAGDPDVVALVGAHLAFARDYTPPGHVHALDAERLDGDGVTVFGARIDGELVGIGALRELDAGHGELKSMHTAAAARGRGVGRQMVDHLLTVARRRGYRRVSLETGTMDAFAPSRALYESAGFEPCEPFGDYLPVPNSVCMTLRLDA